LQLKQKLADEYGVRNECVIRDYALRKAGFTGGLEKPGQKKARTDIRDEKVARL